MSVPLRRNRVLPSSRHGPPWPSRLQAPGSAHGVRRSHGSGHSLGGPSRLLVLSRLLSAASSSALSLAISAASARPPAFGQPQAPQFASSGQQAAFAILSRQPAAPPPGVVQRGGGGLFQPLQAGGKLALLSLESLNSALCLPVTSATRRANSTSNFDQRACSASFSFFRMRRMASSALSWATRAKSFMPEPLKHLSPPQFALAKAERAFDGVGQDRCGFGHKRWPPVVGY